MKTKVCTKCGKEKPLSEFTKHPTCKMGVRNDCRVCEAIRGRIYYSKNKKKINEKHKKDYIKNRKNVTKRHVINNLKRYHSNVNFKILTTFRSRMSRVLKGKTKVDYSLNLLGCTPEFFKKYIESKFTDGMSWDNYGVHGWHIDHIKPCVKFDFNKESDQRKCFHYTNLQPLWAEDNLKKSGNY